MIIGAHVSAAGGIMNAIPRAKEIGASAVQIFASAPGNWNPPKATLEEGRAFGEACRSEGITHIFFHSIYLINLASDKPFLIHKSKESLIAGLNLNAAMGGNGVIFHVGSTKDRTFDAAKENIIKSLNDIIAKSDPKSILIIETNAGQGNCVGDTFEEVAELIAGVEQKERIGVCLDTAHTFASGYDLVNVGPESIMQQFDEIIGLKYLKAIHCNDSKTDFNSRVDRHENIGLGKIGEEPFRQLLHLPELKNIPFILEVPGIEGNGPDRINVDKLKDLAV
ncbi:MAG TPA: deoxyribonuclease IV [Patescibacteria group bacterium]